jgi:hypothetical protein
MPRRPNICPVCGKELPEGQSVHEECALGEEFYKEEGGKKHSCPFCGHFFSGDVVHECAIKDIVQFEKEAKQSEDISHAKERFQGDLEFEIKRLVQIMPYPLTPDKGDKRFQRMRELEAARTELYKIKTWEDLARLIKKVKVIPAPIEERAAEDV